MTEKNDETSIVEQVVRMIRNIRYGSVEITIHDSKVVLIERKEKIRPQTRSG